MASEWVVGRLLNQDDAKLEEVRTHFIQKSGIDLDTLRKDYEEMVFFEERQTPLEWVDSRLAGTKIGKLSPSWKKVLFKKDGHANALLQGHWGELLFNAFKYADHSKYNFLTIRFEEQTMEKHKWLRMIWENPCSGKKENQYGEGLEGISEQLQKLNKTEDKKLTLNYGIKKKRFIVCLSYRSDMLIPYKSK